MNDTQKSRKQREIEQREQLILDVARRHLGEVGYHGLNMDRIAADIEYSKGTIYQHFKNKEDIMLGLAAQAMEKRAELFGKAATFRGRSRERICAIGIADRLFVSSYPDHFRVEQIIRSASMIERTSTDRREVLRICETRCMATAAGIVRDAVSSGDLALPPERTPEDLMFGLWSMAFGTRMISDTTGQMEELGVKDTEAALKQNMHAMLDGYGWKPFSHEWQYDQTEVRIINELYPDEAKNLLATV